MKLKKTKKIYWDKNVVESYNSKIKLKWGYVTFYLHKTNKDRWNYELYWTDTETGSDNTIEIEKNVDFDDIDSATNYIIGIACDYFSDHPMLNKINQNISMLEEHFK